MAKRFTIEDLRSNSPQGPVSTPVDGYVRPNLANQRVPDFTGLSKLSNALAQSSQQATKLKVAKDVEAGEQFGRGKKEKVEVITSALEKATKGLKGKKLSDARREAMLKLTEEGVLPPTANPAFLMGLSRAEAQRLNSQVERGLSEQIESLSAITDEDGNMVEPPDIQGAIDAEYDKALSSPLVQNSFTAKGVIDDSRQKIEDDFLRQVTERRSVALQERKETLDIDRINQGFETNTGDTVGLLTLGDLDSGTPEDIQSVTDGLAHLRNAESSPNVQVLFEAAVNSAVSDLVDDDPESAERLLTRIGTVEIIPGLPVENDARMTRTMANLRQRVENQKNHKSEQHAKAQRTLRSSLDSTFGGLLSNELAERKGEDPTLVVNDVLASMEDNLEVQEIMDAAGVTDIPDSMIGTMRQTGIAISSQAVGEQNTQDRALINGLRKQLIQGGDPDIILKTALGGVFTGDISPDAYTTFQDDIKATTDVIGVAQQLPGFSRVQTTLSSSKIPDGVSLDERQGLETQATEGKEAIFDILLEATKGVTSRQERARIMSAKLKGPEVAEVLDAYSERLGVSDESIGGGRGRFEAALNNGNFEGAREILGTFSAELSPDARTSLTNQVHQAATAFEDTQLKSVAVRTSKATIIDTVSNALTTGGIDGATAAAKLSQLDSEFNTLLRGRMSEVNNASPENRSRVLEGVSKEIAAQLLEEFKDPELEEETESVLTEAFQDSQRFLREMDTKRAFEEGTTVGVALSNFPTLPKGITPEDLLDFDSPTVGGFSGLFTSIQSDFKNLDARQGLRSVMRFESGDEKSLEQQNEGYVFRQSMVGGLSVDTVLSGNTTLDVKLDTRISSSVERTLGLKGQDQRDRAKVKAAAEERGFTVTFPTQEGDTSFNLKREVPLKDAEFHRELSLFFRDQKEITKFFTRPDEERTDFYNKIGMKIDGAEELAKQDKKFNATQKSRLGRIDL